VKNASLHTFPVPLALNAALVFGVLALAIALLKAGSTMHDPLPIGLCGVAFAYLMLTNYSLAHEAAHKKLAGNARHNYWLGMIPAMLFPMSLTLLVNTHARHHFQNRADEEMFDYFHSSDNRALKVCTWYGIMLGVFGLWPPLATVLLAVFPLRWLQRSVSKTKSTRAYVSTFSIGELRRIRHECIVVAAFFCLLIGGLGISPGILLLFYGMALFNWSTRQFVEHAYTSLHPVEGSLNLKHFSVMSWILLHREFDLNHHRQPEVPWIYLPRLSLAGERRIHYLAQYAAMWGGPRLITGDGRVSAEAGVTQT
jgi:fatty acid desaturase